MTDEPETPAGPKWKLNPGQARAMKTIIGRQRHTCLVGGSRSGKTSLFVNGILTRAMRAPGSRHAILRQAANAARGSISLDTLPKVAKLRYPKMELEEHRQDGYFVLPSGSEIWVGGLDDGAHIDKILGREYATILFNECSQIPYSTTLTALTRLAQVAIVNGTKEKLIQRAWYDLNPVGKRHWTNVLFGQRKDPLSGQPLATPDDYARCFLNPGENADNLSAEYIRSLENLPIKQRQRFYEGVYVDEIDGALWSYEGLEIGRVESLRVEDTRRVVVAVDPSGAQSPDDTKRDEIGIVVAALGVDGHGYILADYSIRDSPSVWARRAVQAYRDFGADSIVAEINFGGEMVRSTIRAADPNVSVKVITASRGKHVRAAPVSALYGDPPDYKKNLKIHHVGKTFGKLEDQMVAMMESGYIGEGSPDRVDALVWAITELMLTTTAEAWIAHYQGQADAAREAQKTKTDRPLVDDRPRLEDVDNSVSDAYLRVTNRETSKKLKCAWCGDDVGTNRTSDGEDHYHEHCYHVMLKNGKKIDA